MDASTKSSDDQPLEASQYNDDDLDFDLDDLDWLEESISEPGDAESTIPTDVVTPAVDQILSSPVFQSTNPATDDISAPMTSEQPAQTMAMDRSSPRLSRDPDQMPANGKEHDRPADADDPAASIEEKVGWTRIELLDPTTPKPARARSSGDMATFAAGLLVTAEEILTTWHSDYIQGLPLLFLLNTVEIPGIRQERHALEIIRGQLETRGFKITLVALLRRKTRAIEQLANLAGISKDRARYWHEQTKGQPEVCAHLYLRKGREGEKCSRKDAYAYAKSIRMLTVRVG